MAERFSKEDLIKYVQWEIDMPLVRPSDFYKAMHQIKEVLRAMREPDPETGLYPCGCGGRAVVVHNLDDDGLTDKFYIMCSECKIETNWGYEYKTAERLWQRAMRWRGEE